MMSLFLSAYIDERILCACMQFVIRKLSINAEEIRKQLLAALNSSGEKDRLLDSIRVFEKQVEEHNVKKKKMLSLLLDDVLSKDDYQSAVRDCDAEIMELEQQIGILRKTANRFDKSAEHISRILERVRKYTIQEEVTKQLYSEILEKIVIYSDTHVDVYLQGMAVPFSVSYRRTGRGAQYTVFCEDYNDKC